MSRSFTKHVANECGAEAMRRTIRYLTFLHVQQGGCAVFCSHRRHAIRKDENKERKGEYKTHEYGNNAKHCAVETDAQSSRHRVRVLKALIMDSKEHVSLGSISVATGVSSFHHDKESDTQRHNSQSGQLSHDLL